MLHQFDNILITVNHVCSKQGVRCAFMLEQNRILSDLCNVWVSLFELVLKVVHALVGFWY